LQGENSRLYDVLHLKHIEKLIIQNIKRKVVKQLCTVFVTALRNEKGAASRPEISNCERRIHMKTNSNFICDVCGKTDLIPSTVVLRAEYGSVHDGENILLCVCGKCIDKIFEMIYKED